MKILLVVDIQRGSLTPETPHFDEKGIVNKINLLASAIRSDGGYDLRLFYTILCDPAMI